MSIQAIKRSVQKAGPFIEGMTNRREAYVMPNGDAGQLLRDAVNVDVSAQGRVRRRDGYTLTVAGHNCHSLWSPRSAEYALYVEGSSIKRIDAGGAVSVVRGGLVPSLRMSFADVHGAVYFSNGVDKGSLYTTGQSVMPWLNDRVKWQDRLLEPMPAGQHLCFHNNRLYVSQGEMLYISAPFAPHLMDAAVGFEQFPSHIVMVVATNEGVYVGADVTYFAPGGFPAEALRVVATDAPVEWSDSYDDQTDAVAWLSPQGLCIGNAMGEVGTPQSKHIAVSKAPTGATVTRERDGIRQVIAVLHDPALTGAEAQSFIQARLVRKDTHP